ncbi:DUF4426 domain-containing protein [Endozoicomonas gorgoniicola]|uniref:DUF4426 domain-containing protein n=1 Tax=Endozoicomonas gorgoniicola TaxID=1234144 RepID=A0ABT3N017_9GAMM|nr:DUF4426 domain-containing protein [Endozoicomonas gorgoniicola]MCW7554980.1 DUF4426 domain-containing protein [Endozoicomonas gorgoniicola]
MKIINSKKSFLVLLAGFLIFGSGWAAPVSEAAVPEARLLKNEPLRFGDYEVYFSAFNSTFITPEIARAYQLERSPKYGLVNIAIRNVKDSEVGKAVTAQLEGQQKNLLQQSVSLQFKEVKEGPAVYYLAGFRFSNEELLEFSIDVKPEGSDTSYPVKFRQTFYQDGK